MNTTDTQPKADSASGRKSRAFDANAPMQIDKVTLKWEPDFDGESDAEGCTAEARVSYPIGQGSRRIEWFTSGGLWGIDGDLEYHRQVEDEQLEDLANHLAHFGIETNAARLRSLT